MQRQHRSPAEATEALAAYDGFARRFDDAAGPIRGLVSDLTELATGIKTKFMVQEDERVERSQLLTEGRTREAGAVKIEEVDFAAELKPLLAVLPDYREDNRRFAEELDRCWRRLRQCPRRNCRLASTNSSG